MNLGDGGGGDRRPEGFEQCFDRCAKLGRDDGAGLGIVEGGHPVLQPRQAAREAFADHIAACGEDLTEFDVGGAKLFQCAGQSLAWIVGRVMPGKQTRQSSGQPRWGRIERLILDGENRVVPHQGEQGA